MESWERNERSWRRTKWPTIHHVKSIVLIEVETASMHDRDKNLNDPM
jgi:hypothetical protein